MDPLRRFNRGFTLIELMVSMAASLVIIAGLFYSIIGDLRAYESTRATQGLVTKSRMVVQTLRLYIQQAGFRDIDALRMNVLYAAETSAAGWVWGSGQIIQGALSSSNISDEKTGSDILALRFSGASQGGVVSCDGTHLTTSDTNEVTLYINEDNQLMCRDNASVALLLDENIEFLELLYGTTDAPNRYFTASNISNWDTVNRIKIGLLLSQEVSSNHLINENAYTIFNNTVSSANDTNFRRVVMETILIENQGG